MRRALVATVTILVTTHLMDEVERLADRVAIIDGGRLLAYGTPDELTEAAQRAELRFRAPAGPDLAALAGAAGAPRPAARTAPSGAGGVGTAMRSTPASRAGTQHISTEGG